MPFIKRPLTLAIASVISFAQPSFADIDYTGPQTDIIHRFDSTLNMGVVVHEATVDYLDIDVQDIGEILDGVIIINSTVDKVIIENNGGEINSVADPVNVLGNYGIVISNSTLNDEAARTNVNREFIANYSGRIEGVNDGAFPESNPLYPAIGIESSTVTGNIVNEALPSDNAIIWGSIGIDINNTTLNGSIFNTDAEVNTGQPPTGLVSIAAIEGSQAGIMIQGNSIFNGDIINSGYIVAWGRGGRAINLQSSNVTGNIENSGYIESEQGIRSYNSVFTGNIENSGAIAGDRGIDIYKSVFTGDISNSGSIKADETSTSARGISVNTSTFNGTITNTGDISGYRAVSITEGVLGSLVFNQNAGAITGTSKAVILTNHRFNYLGGSITGDVVNRGGTFYIEGDKVITGDYIQDATATLALGLHQASSLTADNIVLAPGSTLLLDLTKGDIYLQDGATAELLKVSGGAITAENIQLASTNSLVSVASAGTNSAGNFEITLERAPFQEAVQQVIDAGTTGQSAANLEAIGNTLQEMDALAGSNTEIAALLNQINPSNVEQLLPDVSGSALAGNTGASATSGSIVSTRTRTVSAGDTFKKTGLWVQAVYADAEQDNKNGITGYDAQTSGLVIGADGETDSGTVYGAAFTYTNSDSDTNDGNANVSTDYHQLTGYWGYSLGNVLMDGQVYFGKGNNDAKRLGVGGIASADFDTTQYGLQLSSGYNLSLDNGLQLTPRVSLDYGQLKSDSYTETGTASGLLSVEKEKLDRLELGLSAEISKSFQTSEMLITPRANLGIYHDFEAEAQTVTAAFQSAPDISFASEGADVSRNRYVAAVGAEFAKGENFSAQVEYNYNWKDSFDAHTGAVKLRWEF